VLIGFDIDRPYIGKGKLLSVSLFAFNGLFHYQFLPDLTRVASLAYLKTKLTGNLASFFDGQTINRAYGHAKIGFIPWNPILKYEGFSFRGCSYS
jgi:hypothetical protein